MLMYSLKEYCPLWWWLLINEASGTIINTLIFEALAYIEIVFSSFLKKYFSQN